MYLNKFASTDSPLDMTPSDEFASLLSSAADLSISHHPEVRYRSRNIIANHQRFHFLEWGSPELPTVLLLHGSNQSAHSWDLVSLHLSSRFHVLALDQRGHGDSEWARDVDYSASAMAHDALAFMDELAVEQPIVVGHSMGGLNSMRLILDQPRRVRALVLVDIGPVIAEAGAKAVRHFVTEHREFDDLDAFVRAVQKYDPYRSREHIERTVKYNMLQRADGKYVSKRDHGPRLAATGEHRDRHDRFSLEEAATIEHEVLLIRGADSNILTPEGATAFVDALPRGRLETVTEAGHNVHGQNTSGFLEAINPFLNSL
jgi:esterase